MQTGEPMIADQCPASNQSAIPSIQGEHAMAKIQMIVLNIIAAAFIAVMIADQSNTFHILNIVHQFK
jgi:hypothetical protein